MELQNLPAVVRKAIREGTYSLYRVKVWTAPSVEFLLLTDTAETFVMDGRGTVLTSGPISKDNLEFVEAITLSD